MLRRRLVLVQQRGWGTALPFPRARQMVNLKLPRCSPIRIVCLWSMLQGASAQAEAAALDDVPACIKASGSAVAAPEQAPQEEEVLVFLRELIV